MAKSKKHKPSEKPPAKSQREAASQAIPLDELFDEMLVLEAVVYGLCTCPDPEYSGKDSTTTKARPVRCTRIVKK